MPASSEPNAAEGQSSRRSSRLSRAGDLTALIEANPILEVVQGLKKQIADKEKLLKTKSQALIAERNFIENIIESVGDSLIVVSPTGLIQSVNPATCALLGYAQQDLVDTPFDRLLANPDQRQLFSEPQFFERLQKIETDFFEVQWLSKSQEALPISWRGSVLRNGDGEVKGYVGIARDLREERRIQEAKIKAVQAMAASVAHEIRNPLGAIQNAIALLLRDLVLKGEDRELMEIVREETLRIQSIVTQFLNFAQPTRSVLQVSDMSGLLRDLVKIVECDERMDKGHSFDLDIRDPLPQLRFDANQIKQVLWNLLSNGLDAMSQAGVLSLRAFAVEDFLIIEVQDSGAGIPAEKLKSIYEPFVTTKARGTGLGLVIAKQILDQHRADLQVKTKAGFGTCLTIRMPIEASQG